MSTILNKANEILNEKETKIIPENIKKDVQIFDITGTYEGSSNIYKVATIQARNALNASIGDNCLVYDKGIRNTNVNSTIIDLHLPPYITFETAITEQIGTGLSMSDGSHPGPMSLNITPTNIMFDIRYSEGSDMFHGELMIQYSSEDGIHYTRTTNGWIMCPEYDNIPPEGEDIDINIKDGLIYELGSSTWDDKFGQVLQINKIDFSGLYQLDENKLNSWKVQDNKYMYEGALNLNGSGINYGCVMYLYNILYDTYENNVTHQSIKVIKECDVLWFDSILYLRPQESTVSCRIDSEGLKYLKTGSSTYGGVSVYHYINNPNVYIYEQYTKIKDIPITNGVETLLLEASEIPEDTVLFMGWTTTTSEYSTNEFKIYNADKTQVIQEADFIENYSLDLGTIWNYLDIDVKTKDYQVVNGENIYTNEGFINGTLYANHDNRVDNDWCSYADKYINFVSNISDWGQDISGDGAYGIFRGFKGKYIPILPYVTSQNINSFYCAFANCHNLVTAHLPNITTTNDCSFGDMFSMCTNITDINLGNLQGSYPGGICDECTSLVNFIAPNISVVQTNNSSSYWGARMFYNCSSLHNLNLSNWDITLGGKQLFAWFGNCTSLEKLDIRNITFTSAYTTNASLTSGGFSGVPNNCLIIVKDTTAKNSILKGNNRFTNIKTVSEYEGN